jgi:hypothetical protein
MKQKSEVYKCFQDLLAYVKIQFGVHVKVLRTDNEIEYINKEFTVLTSS